jgi:hypothetical protein
MKMAKAMGLNAFTLYAFWNVHESVRGKYDFSGQNDVGEFIREAQKAGLYVILRPGPYVCAEWEFGGFPAWLLADSQTIVRSRDPRYLVPATRWLYRLGQELAPLQLARGGPIAPHCPLGPIALAACMQLAALAPNFVNQEMSLGIHYNTSEHDLLTYLKNPDVFRVQGGLVAVLEGRGLGVVIDEARVREAARTSHEWRNPVWRGPDGSVREW